MAKNAYTVIAGNWERPAFIKGQVLEKGLDADGKDRGTGQPSGDERLYALRRQDIGIPNYAQAWGVRTYDDGVIPENPIEVKDPKYHGKIEFLAFGDVRGTLIECRYLKNYNTLDVQYQNLVLNVKIDDTDPTSADAFFIILQSGENEFDEVRDKMKVQMLKISSYNSGSVCRNPDAIHALYREKNNDTDVKIESKSLDAKTEALMIVGNAASDNTYGRLHNLFNIVGVLFGEKPEDNELFVTLQQIADSKPVDFLGKIEDHKRYISNIFEKAKSYKVIDCTKDGVIVAGDSKKEIICEDVPAKGENMLLWLLTNHLDPKANEAIFKLKKITDKLK